MPQEVWDQLTPMMVLELLVPALAVSCAVMLILRLVGRERLAPLAAGLAVGAGVVAGNYFTNAIEWDLNDEQPLPSIIGWSLELPREPGEALPPVRYWLPWSAALAILVELVVGLPFVPTSLGWIARSFVAVLAARLLTSAADWRLDMPWLTWALAASIALNWAVLEALTRKWKDGTTAVALALCFVAAAVVIEWDAHTKRYADMALFFFGSLLAVGLTTFLWQGNTTPALAAGAVFLPSVLYVSYHDFPGEPSPPVIHFLLVGLAPLALMLMFLPYFTAQRGWIRWLVGIVAPLIPALLAVVLVFCQPQSHSDEEPPPTPPPAACE